MNIFKNLQSSLFIISAASISILICPDSSAFADTMIYKLHSFETTLPLIARLGDKEATHSMVVEHLMTAATVSQSGFVSRLDQLHRSGNIISYRRLWIINAVEVTADNSTLESLRSHADVEYAFESVPVELMAPVERLDAAPFNIGHEFGLEAIGAPEVWAMGIDGTGSIVCNFDTGVDATHPALYSKFRGNNGAPVNECWFDPGGGQQYPQDLQGHGTHTMGTMVGSDGADTIGVAPGAQWIAARAIGGGGILRTIGDLLAAFQWAADPDGNPRTTDDVPDVVNNSWGIPAGYFGPCDSTFWEALDNLEAAGVVAIFGSGNEGPGEESVRTPADRIASPFNCFSVGAVYTGDSIVIAEFSSRGPSGCDHITIKPEVTAPGVAVRSSYLEGGYTALSGTSMAAPHVAGAVALLRQFNPNATPDEIKAAIINSAVDYGPVGEDNSYGWGLLNVWLAIHLLPESTPVLEDGLPQVSSLIINYPNPFNSSTIITLGSQSRDGEVISIYDISGRIIRRLKIDAGRIAVWNGEDDKGRKVSTGIYFAKADGSARISRKMSLIK